MRILLRAVFALLITTGLTNGAHAVAVTPGTQYTYYIGANAVANVMSVAATFDGLPTAFLRNGLDLALNESQTDLGSGNWLITLALTSRGDIFPGAADVSLLGMGIAGDGLDLTSAFRLDDARIQFITDEGQTLQTGNLAAFFPEYFGSPWNGDFGLGILFSTGNVGDRGITEIRMLFSVSPFLAVPEPTALALVWVGLLALWKHNGARTGAVRLKR
ncbi:hypothetical protein ACDA63_09830 [Uliginosibacterium sp. sgz301328]|uniref:hypothetical protein n=1 Tax=Uliginosibacterium sp. sgz301328 TaxID=3243764 RepID=UPI00359EFFAC